MPEGDTLHRTASGLAPHLVGRPITAARVRPGGPQVERVVGSTVTEVVALGKNLLIRFDNGLEIRTHLRMTGSWHRYRPGERWRRSPARARLVLEVPGAVASHGPRTGARGARRARPARRPGDGRRCPLYARRPRLDLRRPDPRRGSRADQARRPRRSAGPRSPRAARGGPDGPRRALVRVPPRTGSSRIDPAFVRSPRDHPLLPRVRPGDPSTDRRRLTR